MISLDQILTLVNDNVAAWQDLRIASLQFWQRDTARLALIAILAVSLILLIVRSSIRRMPGRHRLVVPALLTSLPRSRMRLVVHTPLVLFLIGLPFFILALADPYTSLVSQDVSFPGRRISVMIDASSSMHAPFTAAKLNPRSPTEAAFFTAVAAAERFVRMRLNGKYRDLLALVEFGNQAYVITPFTNDYDNILLSIALIGDPVEFSLFPDQGTVIAQAIEQSTELFKMFNFLEASGNLMVLFTDGEDTRTVVHGRSLDDILESAVQNHIPVYLVRTEFDRKLGEIIPDALWKASVEKTGGKFFAAADEASLLQAIQEIDAASTGTIQIKQYTNQQPRFSIFAVIAAGLWAGSAALKLAVPYFQKLP
jgi:hypothetical protein